ncbi:MAG: hypothetical protein IKF82_01275 [Bacilli bacterium]|nr:hypothetical protein [Bacilli bacterium]
MFKKLLVLGMALLTGLGIMTATVTYADTTAGEPVEVKEEYPCHIKELVGKGGNILFDKTEGEVGDVVTAYIKADFLFVVKSIKFNDNVVQISKDNKYEFTLVEGENTVVVECEVNNEKLTEIAELINGVKENGFASLFTINNLLNLISWVLTLFLSSGFFVTLIRNKKIKAKTVEQVQEAVTEVIDTKVSEGITNFLKDILKPIIENLLEKIDGSDECMRVLCRCFVLAQDNTAENRLAIINELTKLNNSDEKLSNQIRAIIKEEQKAQQAKIEARDKAIEELEEANKNLIKEEQADEYGQF